MSKVTGPEIEIRHAPRPGGPDRGLPPAPGMVRIPGGTFLMGSDHHYPEEASVHGVRVDGFWMDRMPVATDHLHVRQRERLRHLR